LSRERLGTLFIFAGIAVFFGIDAFLMPLSLGVVFVGVGLFVWASLRQRAERRLEQRYEVTSKKVEVPPRPPMPRRCSGCGADLSALLFKKYLPIIDIEEVLFFILPSIAQGLTLSSTLFSASTSLLRKVKGLKWTKKRNLKIFIALLTLTPLILMLVIPVQAKLGPPFNIGISASGGGSRLQTPYAPAPPPAYLDYNATGNQWIYRIHFTYLGGPPGQVAINKILLGSEVLTPPFNSNIVQVNGTGIALTQDGIVFTQGADGYVTLKPTQAYTKIVFFDSDGAKYTFLW